MTSQRLAFVAGSLGVTMASLTRLGVGWTGTALSFPMTDAGGVVRGIRLRNPDGSKFSVKGGREALFVPEGRRGSYSLLLCEGPTDTAAMLDLGFDAIGRPSARGGRTLAVDYVRRHGPEHLVIVADRDDVGLQAAAELGRVLRLHCRDVRLVTPPDGVHDAREWVRVGATHQMVTEAIHSAAPLFLRASVRLEGVAQ